MLAAALASVPRLRAPQGCVRTRFRVSIKSAGVHSVTFYLDGHKLKTLTYKNAHKRLAEPRRSTPANWKVGVHRAVGQDHHDGARSHESEDGLANGTRRLRCRPAVLTPKFTG